MGEFEVYLNEEHRCRTGKKKMNKPNTEHTGSVI